MTSTRDRLTAVAAVAILIALAVAVVTLVLDAQRAGIDTREELRLEQVTQLANSMDTRVQAAYGQLGATVGAPGAWTLTPRDPGDAARLAPQNPQATTGAVLTDRRGEIVNGSLLRDPGLIGDRLDRPGLDAALAGQPVILPVAPGVTTTDPTLAIAVPVRDATGGLAGAYVVEVEVTATSAFNQEVAELRAGDTGAFSFVDSTGTVVASSDETLLARPLERDAEALAAGFHRIGGRVTAVADVPSASWRLIFEQTRGEFEGDVTGPVRWALLLLTVVVALAGSVLIVALLRRLRAVREEQRRMAEIAAAREEFTSIVSHELRTPVAGLLGFLKTTIDHWEQMDDDERRRAVGRALDNARRLEHLTTDVSDTSSIEGEQLTYLFEVVDLRDVAGAAVELAKAAEPHRTFAVELGDQPVPVRADPQRLRQVITNVLDNAVKSSPVEEPVRTTLEVTGSEASIRIADRGPGIPADERERIFEKFRRGRARTTTGSGLGLYIAHQIVVAHEGRISVAASDEPGAVIEIVLPLAPSRASADA